MRVRVDRDLCDANAVCEGIAPEVFHVDDDDELQVLVGEVPAALLADVERAVRSCPKGALSLEG